MESGTANNPKGAMTLYTLATVIPESQFQEWAVSAQLAAKLLEFSESERKIVIDQVSQRETEQGKQKVAEKQQVAISMPELAGFLKEIFTFPPINKERLHCEPCMREDNNALIHVAFGIISPLSKLKWLGSGFITEGKYIGEGKDAIVHAVKGNSDWVIKELKFGGEERAKMLEFYTNQLAADVRFMVPELTHLDGGRLLQKFVSGNPINNVAYTLQQLAAQNEAIALASAAKQALGIRGGEEYIKHPPYDVGVDPSFANFLFNSEGKLTGWIDPLYSISR